jgi:hypothetical protein
MVNSLESDLEQDETPENRQDKCRASRDYLKWDTSKIQVIDGVVDSLLPNIDEAFDDLGESRVLTFGDSGDVHQRMNALSLSNANTKALLAVQAAGLKSHSLKTTPGITDGLLSDEMNGLNIVHDLINVITLGLQGKHDNGELHGLFGVEFESYIQMIITSAGRVLNRIKASPDKIVLKEAVEYTKAHYQSDPLSTASVVSQNVSWLVLWRRSWQWL